MCRTTCFTAGDLNDRKKCQLNLSFTMKQFFFVTAKDAEELKGCFILHGTEEDLQFLGKLVDSNKLCFGGVVLPARLDDRQAHLTKYCAQYGEYKDLMPNYETSHNMEDIVVLLIETRIISEAAFSEELKTKVMNIYNEVKERGGPTHNTMDQRPIDMEQDGKEMMAPPRPKITVARKPTEVEIQIKKLLDNSETLYNSNVRLLKSVAEMHEEISKLRAGQEQMNNRLDDVASASVSTFHPNKKFKCSFCESDDHGFKECEAKELCVNCGLDNHRSQKCFWMGNTCSFCKTEGHASKLHQVTDQKFRLAIMNTHGPEKFAHFWAPEKKQEAPVVQIAEEYVQRKSDEGQRSVQHRNQGQQAKNYRQQESKPYNRPQLDPWTGSSRSRSRKPRR